MRKARVQASVPVCPRFALFVFVTLLLEEAQHESIADTINDNFDLLDEEAVVEMLA